MSCRVLPPVPDSISVCMIGNHVFRFAKNKRNPKCLTPLALRTPSDPEPPSGGRKITPFSVFYCKILSFISAFPGEFKPQPYRLG
jgi:hypothetical protein